MRNPGAIRLGRVSKRHPSERSDMYSQLAFFVSGRRTSARRLCSGCKSTRASQQASSASPSAATRASRASPSPTPRSRASRGAGPSPSAPASFVPRPGAKRGTLAKRQRQASLRRAPGPSNSKARALLPRLRSRDVRRQLIRAAASLFLFRSAGATPVDLGLATTPACFMSCITEGAQKPRAATARARVGRRLTCRLLHKQML